MTSTLNHDQLAEMPCPVCGGPMSRGYIAGHWTRLRWTLQEKTKTIFAGSPLRKKRDWLNAPTVQACRCSSCRVGMFIYDND